MTVAILADDVLKQELLTKKLPETISVVWVDSVRSLTIADADVYLDLLFEQDPERTQQLKRLLPKPVMVNAVPWTTKKISADFIRINAWPGLLQRPVTEIALPAGVNEATIKAIFEQWKWQYVLTPDIPGMITARVLATIINEAYYTLGAEVSSREEIDIAMKLGTSYPYGPFEWSDNIGLHRVYELLAELSKVDARYIPAPGMKEAVSSK